MRDRRLSVLIPVRNELERLPAMLAGVEHPVEPGAVIDGFVGSGEGVERRLQCGERTIDGVRTYVRNLDAARDCCQPITAAQRGI
jgi:hypothetical protein